MFGLGGMMGKENAELEDDFAHNLLSLVMYFNE